MYSMPCVTYAMCAMPHVLHVPLTHIPIHHVFHVPCAMCAMPHVTRVPHVPYVPCVHPALPPCRMHHALCPMCRAEPQNRRLCPPASTAMGAQARAALWAPGYANIRAHCAHQSQSQSVLHRATTRARCLSLPIPYTLPVLHQGTMPYCTPPGHDAILYSTRARCHTVLHQGTMPFAPAAHHSESLCLIILFPSTVRVRPGWCQESGLGGACRAMDPCHSNMGTHLLSCSLCCFA